MTSTQIYQYIQILNTFANADDARRLGSKNEVELTKMYIQETCKSPDMYREYSIIICGHYVTGLLSLQDNPVIAVSVNGLGVLKFRKLDSIFDFVFARYVMEMKTYTTLQKVQAQEKARKEKNIAKHEYIKLKLGDAVIAQKFSDAIPDVSHRIQLLIQMLAIACRFGLFVYGSLFSYNGECSLIRSVMIEAEPEILQAFLTILLVPMKMHMNWCFKEDGPEDEILKKYVDYKNAKSKISVTVGFLKDSFKLSTTLNNHPVVTSNGNKIKLSKVVEYNKLMGGEDTISKAIGNVKQQIVFPGKTKSHGRIMGEYITLLLHQLFKIQQLKWCKINTLRQLQSISQFRDHRKKQTNKNCGDTASFKSFLMVNVQSLFEKPPIELEQDDVATKARSSNRVQANKNVLLSELVGIPPTLTTPKKYSKKRIEDALSRPKSINCIGYPGAPVTLTEKGQSDYVMRSSKRTCCICKLKHSKMVYCHGCHAFYCFSVATSGVQKEAKTDTATGVVTEHSCYHRSHIFQFEGEVTERLNQGNLTAPSVMIESTPQASARPSASTTPKSKRKASASTSSATPKSKRK